MASVNDKITDTRNSDRPNSARVSSTRSVGGTTLACNDLTGWPTASKVHGVTYQIDSNSNPIDGTQIDFYGIVSGSNITNFTVVDGTDNGNSVNDVVEMLPTAAWGQDLSDALMTSHNRDGSLKDGAVDSADVLASNVVTTAKILDSNVTTDKIADNAVTAAKIANRTRRIWAQMGADETGGATTFNNYGKEVKFTAGAVSGYARGAFRVPKDYVAGTTANIIFIAMMNATQSLAFQYYVEGLAVGGDGITTPWNIASSATTSSQSFTAKLLKEVTLYTIAAADLAADKFFGVAFKPNSNPSADMEVLGIAFEYTADS